jgi:hypothetical protein
MNNGVSGIVTTCITGHCTEPLAQHINNLPLTLIAPLGAQNHRRLRSHQQPASLRNHTNTRRSLKPQLRAGEKVAQIFTPRTILNPELEGSREDKQISY